MTREQQLQQQVRREQDRNRQLAARVRELETTREARQRALSDAELRALRPSEVVFKTRGGPPRKGPGTPTLLLSDLHVNESVDPRQVLGTNAFGPEEARRRLESLFATAVDLGIHHMVKPSYDGIVVPVAGDLLDVLGGAQHPDERQATPRYVDAAALVADLLEPGFRLLADAFGSVRSPWVTGNHGRLTGSMPFQDRSAKSLDAAVYHILEGRLRRDRRFQFELAPGPKLLYQVYDHRYLLLHGDPASGMPRGGSALGGSASTIARGLVQMASSMAARGLRYDTAVLGHFHTYMVLPGGIVNGSLIGYNEYAEGRSFSFEEPRQAFWFTHPKYGITCSWPIYVAKREAAK